MRLSIIAAIGKNRELGKNGKIPWHIPDDLRWFKTLTSGHSVIMGRKTWDSLPTKPLPNRMNIIISRNPSLYDISIYHTTAVCGSLKEALRLAQSKLNEKGKPNDEVFIIGGGQIFEQAIPLADKLYLTVVDANFDADAFFPPYPQFKKVVFEETHESGGYQYKFLELER